MADALRLVAIGETPDSVLRDRAGDATLVHKRPMFIGDRPRLSTCSDVVWIRSHTVVTCNLAGQALHVYDYRADACKLDHRQTVHTQFTLGGLALSPDEQWLAVTHSDPGFRVALHKISADGAVSSTPTRESPVLGRKFVHGVRFSPDGRYLVVAQFEISRNIVILDPHTLSVIRELPTPFASSDVLFAKSACFSLDARFVFVAYSRTASKAISSTSALIAVHAYSAVTGEFSDPISSFSKGLSNIESLDLLDGGTILAVDQYLNCVFAVSFNPDTMRLTSRRTVLDARNGLCSPHGISVAASGAVALTDHVSDSVRVYIPSSKGTTSCEPKS